VRTLTAGKKFVRSVFNFNILQHFIALKVEKMVSNTAVTRNKRENKKSKAGKKRKAENNNKGTTPKFSIHPEKK